MRWKATLLMLVTGCVVGCGSSTTVREPPAEASNDWQPGQIEDARDAPQEKIDAWKSRFGRERPIVALLGHNASTELADYITPHGVLARADVAEVVSVSTGASLITTQPLKIEAQLNTKQFDDRYAEGADYVIVPAIFQGNDEPDLLEWISDQAGKGATLVSICLGAHVVANTGLMDGHRATSHFSSEDKRAQIYPQVRWQKNTRWVADGKIVSSAGISAAIPISIALVEAIAGHERAAAVAQELGVTSWSSKHDSDVFRARPDEERPNMDASTKITLGIPLTEGMDEIALGLTADAYNLSNLVKVQAIAGTLDPVTTLSGLRIVPERTVSGPEQVDRVLPYVEVKPALHALDVALQTISDDYGRAASCNAAFTMEHPSYEMCP